MFLPLSNSVDQDQPVLGLHIPVSEARRLRVPARIEETAGELVRYVREVQPAGPYHLAGLCVSGLLAYEMARQLVSQRYEVALLALFDVPSPSARLQPTKVEMLWTEMLEGGVEGVPGFIHRRCHAIARQLKLFRWKIQQSLGLTVNMNKLLNDPDAIEETAAYFSKPRPYPGRVIFFRSDDWRFPEAVWKGMVTGGWHVYRVAGGHISMFHRENVGALAETLQACLSDHRGTKKGFEIGKGPVGL